jgi:hypothetical protein
MLSLAAGIRQTAHSRLSFLQKSYLLAVNTNPKRKRGIPMISPTITVRQNLPVQNSGR